MSSTCHVSFLAAPDTVHLHQFFFYLPLLSFQQSLRHTQDFWYTMNIYPATFHGRVADQHKSLLLQVMSPKVIDTNVIDSEAIEPEDLELGRIELVRNLRTDPYQIQKRFVRENHQNPIAEDVEGFGKVGAEKSYIQSQMHSDYDSPEHCRVGS